MSSDKINPKAEDEITSVNLGLMGLKIQIKSENPHSKSVLSSLSAEDILLFKDYYNTEFRPMASYLNGNYWDAGEMTRFELKVIRANSADRMNDLLKIVSYPGEVTKDVNDRAQAMAMHALKVMISRTRGHRTLNKALISAGTMLPIEILLSSPEDLIASSNAVRHFQIARYEMADGNDARLVVPPFMYFVGNQIINLNGYFLPPPKPSSEENWASIQSSDLSEESLDALIKSVLFFESLSQLSAAVWHKAMPLGAPQVEGVCKGFLQSVKHRGRGKPLSFSLSISLAYIHPHLNSFDNVDTAIAVFHSLCKYTAIFDAQRETMLRVLPGYMSLAFGISLAQVSRDVLLPNLCQALSVKTTETELMSLKGA